MYTAAPRRAKSLIRGLRTLRTPYAKKKPSSDVSGVGHGRRARFSKYHVIVKIVVDSLLWNRPLDEPLPTHFFLEAARFFLGFSTSASA